MPTDTTVNILTTLCTYVEQGDDAVTRALLRLAQAGHDTAGRVVVQAMMPRLWCIARRDPQHVFDDYISAAWIRLMTFPALKRRQALLTNLCLDCLKTLTRQTAKTQPETSLDTDLLNILSAMPPWHILESPQQTSDYTQALLDLAAHNGLTSQLSVKVVKSIHWEGLTGRQAAARHGISHDMVRYYCRSLVKTLRAHSNELIEQLGPPQ